VRRKDFHKERPLNGGKKGNKGEVTKTSRRGRGEESGSEEGGQRGARLLLYLVRRNGSLKKRFIGSLRTRGKRDDVKTETELS